jgi:DNA-binding beta-propeller fold protein YncE
MTRPLTTRSAACLAAFLAAVLPAAAAPTPEPRETAVDLKGTASQVDDLTVTPIKLEAKELVPALTWGDAKGTVLFALEAKGVVHRIAVPELKETHKLDAEHKCSSLAVCAEGLLLTVSDAQEVWVLDPDKLTVKRKIDVPGASRTASAPGLAVAFTSGKNELYVLDVKAGKAALYKPKEKVSQFLGYNNPVATPDGNYLFTTGNFEQMARFRIADNALKFEEESQRLAQGPLQAGIQVSPDSKYVCLPSRGGNYSGLKGHPDIKGYSTYVYPVDSFSKPAFTLEQGSVPAAVGFDPEGKRIYSQNIEKALLVFSATGIKKKEYALGGGLEVRQYLVHPGGNKLLLLTEKALNWIELPKE